MDVDKPDYENIAVDINDIHDIVLSYLVHNCFKDTAESLVSFNGTKLSDDILEDMEKRKLIISLAMDGNALKAIELTNEVAPALLEKNKELYFDMLSLHFVELLSSRKWMEAVEFTQKKLTPFGKLQKFDEKLKDFMTLLAYQEPEKCVMSHLLSVEYREQVVDTLNRAIVAHANRPNRPSYTALERSIQQTTVVSQCLSQECDKDVHSSFSLEEFLKS